jgi:hypothetical protein
MSPAHCPRCTVVYAGLSGVLNLHHPGFVEFFDSSPASDASLRLDGRSCPSRSFDSGSGLADAPCAWPPAGTHHCSTSAPSNTICRYRMTCRTTGTGSLGAGQGHEEGRSASLPALQEAGRRAKKKLPFVSFRLVAELIRSPKGVKSSGFSLAHVPSMPESCQSFQPNVSLPQYPFLAGLKFVPNYGILINTTRGGTI